MTSSCYVPSGRVGPRAAWLAVLCALATIPVAWACAWLTVHAPSPVGAIAVLFAGALVLMPLSVGLCRLGQVRNPRRMAWIGMALGALFWYVQWAAYGALTLHRIAAQPLAATFAGMAVQPWTIAAFARADLARRGLVTASGWTFAGVGMLMAWLLEFLYLLAMPRNAGKEAAGAVFCEHSLSWASKVFVERKFKWIEDAEAVARLLEAQPQRFTSVLAAWPAGQAVDYAEVDIHACAGPHCYVTLTNYAPLSGSDNDAVAMVPVIECLHLPGVRAADLERQLNAVGTPYPDDVES